MSRKLDSENIVISSPLSFSGSSKRLWKLTYHDNLYLKWILLVPLAVLLICCAWTFVVFWYILMYGIFGVFFFIWRLFRRSSRQSKAEKLRHREILEQLEKRDK